MSIDFTGVLWALGIYSNGIPLNHVFVSPGGTGINGNGIIGGNGTGGGIGSVPRGVYHGFPPILIVRFSHGIFYTCLASW
jgi:hypothetical protein